ncbi:MAG TPA: peptidylprolyl isomerase, partial [Humisphaera sp.]
VRMVTSLGNVDVELFDQAALKTAQNFVNYVANGLFNGTVLHRSEPGSLVGGGAYVANGQHVLEGPAIPNEYSAERPNVRGTIASFRPAGQATATSEWFINTGDNSESQGAANNGGAAVFGQVINGTMTTVDAINALSVIDASAVAAPFNKLPVRNVPAGAPGINDFVFLNNASVIPDTKFLTLAAESSDPAVVTPTIADGVLTLTYGATRGTATITVTATDAGGQSASQSFQAGNGELTVEVGSGGVGASVPFTEADGGKGTVSLAKGGSAFVRFAGDNLAVSTGKKPAVTGGVTGIAGIAAIDTTTNSTLAVATKGGDGAVDVGTITTDGPLKALTLKSARVSGASVTVGGTVRSVTLGTVSGSTLTFGGAPEDGIAMALSVGSVSNTNLTSGVPIKSIKATEWLATNTPGTITAPAVTSVASKGAFQESLATSGPIKSIKAGGAQKGNVTATALGSLSAASLDGGTFTITGGGKSVGKISTKGTITGTTILSAGDVGSITAREVASGRFYAGVTLTDDQEIPPFLPTDLAQFSTPARIGSVKVATRSSQLSMAATRLGKLSLGELDPESAIGGGLAALQIDALAAKTPTNEAGPGQSFSFKKLDDQATFDALVAARALSLGSFQVTLF